MHELPDRTRRLTTRTAEIVIADTGPHRRVRSGWVLRLLTRAESPQMRRRRTRHGIDVRAALSPQAAIQFFRENQIALIYDRATGENPPDTWPGGAYAGASGDAVREPLQGLVSERDPNLGDD